MSEIEFTLVNGLKTITAETLKRISPRAAEAAGIDKNMNEEDLEMIWVMTQKPVLLEDHSDDDERDDLWSETNEYELAEDLSEDWDKYAVTVGNQKVVILCGSYDDEYGRYWNETTGCWVHYNC